MACTCARNLCPAVSAGKPFDGRGRHVDGKQQGSDLIMQVSREIGSLLRLQCQQSFVQAMVLRRGHGEPLCHEIEAVRHALQLRRTICRQQAMIFASANTLKGG